jgi:hypothetical protein
MKPPVRWPSDDLAVRITRQADIPVRNPLYCGFQIVLGDVGKGRGKAECHHLLDLGPTGIERDTQPGDGLGLHVHGGINLGFNDERLPTRMLDDDVRT